MKANIKKFKYLKQNKRYRKNDNKKQTKKSKSKIEDK